MKLEPGDATILKLFSLYGARFEKRFKSLVSKGIEKKELGFWVVGYARAVWIDAAEPVSARDRDRLETIRRRTRSLISAVERLPAKLSPPAGMAADLISLRIAADYWDELRRRWGKRKADGQVAPYALIDEQEIAILDRIEKTTGSPHYKEAAELLKIVYETAVGPMKRTPRLGESHFSAEALEKRRARWNQQAGRPAISIGTQALAQQVVRDLGLANAE